MRRSRLVTVAVAALLALTAIGGGMGAVTAQSGTDDAASPIDGLFGADDSDDDDGLLPDIIPGEDDSATVVGYASGWLDRAMYSLESRFGSSEETVSASEVATSLSDDLNTHADAYEAYLNEFTGASTAYDSIRYRVMLDGETATRYIVANVTDVGGESAYQDLRAVNGTTYDGLNRTVDESMTLCGIAAANAADDLRKFREEYVATNTSIREDPSLLAELRARNTGDVAGTIEMLPDSCGEDS